MNKETLLINILSGPGCGKSTTAAGVFALLKMHNIGTELPYEFAKDLIWDDRDLSVFEDQLFVSGNQHRRLKRLEGKVDVIVCDSSLLLGLIYAPREDKDLIKPIILKKFNEFNNINFLLKRSTKLNYEANGRNQTQSEAKALDAAMRNVLIDNDVPFTEVEIDENSVNRIVEHILNKYFDMSLKYKIYTSY